MAKPKRFLITSALPYANGPIHIGHLAGAYLPADIFARYQRSLGHDVLYVCGSDEHGAAITLKAKKEKRKPQEIVNTYHEMIRKGFEDFGFSFDIYHRTSSTLHHETAAAFFKTLHARGAFEKIESQQFYDEKHQQFLADRYITGTCPHCGYNNAYGDQCENCGSTLNPADLIQPKSVLSGEVPILKNTSHYYLPLQNHEEWLRDWLTNGVLEGHQQHDAGKWKKSVMGQCLSWLNTGLQRRAMTRDLDWGVKVPLENEEGKVLYVWLDAPIGYISATKAWAEANNKSWEPYWQNPETELIHFIGKDNIVFHCIIFPCILKLHGNYNLPVNVPANEFLNLEGEKISTSRNWAVWLHEYQQDFPNKQDELRYVLTAISPEQKDSEFTWSDFQSRVNNELVAIFGNFVNRSLVLTHKYYEGVVPNCGELLDSDRQMIEKIQAHYQAIGEKITDFKFREALSEAMNIARMGNKYLADEEPWKLIKTDPKRVETIMYLSLQITTLLSNAFAAFMPFKSKALSEMLLLKDIIINEDFDFLPSGHKIGAAALLFEKINDEAIEQQLEKLRTNQLNKSKKIMESKANISFEDFQKLDLRIGHILSAQKVPKTDKLMQLTVDLGFEERTIVSGIAAFFNQEELTGKSVIVVVNLAPRKIRGVMSQGMILMAENNEGELIMIGPEKAINAGATVS